MSEIPPPKTGRRPRVSKLDWLNAALRELKDHGIEAVRVERLAASLNVAKSGFYYHFADRDHLCRALLDHWLNTDGVPAAHQKKLKDPSPEEVLLHTIEIVDKYTLGQLDMAVRQWARSDPEVNKVYRREMRNRIRHIRGIFETLGFEGDQLEMRTRTFVATTTSEYQLFSDLKAADRRRIQKLRVKMLIQRD